MDKGKLAGKVGLRGKKTEQEIKQTRDGIWDTLSHWVFGADDDGGSSYRVSYTNA